MGQSELTELDKKECPQHVTAVETKEVKVLIDTVDGQPAFATIFVRVTDTPEQVKQKIHNKKAEAQKEVDLQNALTLKQLERNAIIIFCVGWIFFPVWFAACAALCRPNMTQCTFRLNVVSTVLAVITATTLVMVAMLYI